MIDESFFSPGLKLGILGGGQLGLMLSQVAIDYGVEIFILDPNVDAPCRAYTRHFVLGSFSDYDAVYAFGKMVDILTIEIEHVSVKALKQLQSEGLRVFPQPDIIETIQDKGKQKEFYEANNIPSASFCLIENKAQLYDRAADFLPAVLKTRKAGYDGKGVVVLKNVSDLEKAFDEPCVLETKVAIEKELSVIVARSGSGETMVYDVVEMKFDPEANLVDYLTAPAQIPDVVSDEAKKIAQRLIELFQLTGLLAVEFFLTTEQKLLVNEVAPRPHNSGHHTIESCYTSQYAQHLRAILNLPLGSAVSRSNAVMVNLLGEAGFTGPVVYKGIAETMKTPEAFLHLYGKTITKPFRKMGHVTILGTSPEDAHEKAMFIKDKLRACT